MNYKHSFIWGEPFDWSICWDKSAFSNIPAPDDYSTLENIAVCLKQCPTEDEQEYKDNDIFMELRQLDELGAATGKVSFDPLTHTLTINPAPSDFTNVEKDRAYFVVIAWKVSEYPEWIELSYKLERVGDNVIFIAADSFSNPLT